MATIPRRPRVVRAAEEVAINLPEHVTIALRELAGAAKQGLLALSVGLGLAVVGEIFEEEVTALVGPRGKHDTDRQAYRHGKEAHQLTLGGRRVPVMKPRARTKAGKEVELKSYELFASRDLLTQAALDRMLAGLSSRKYRKGLEPVGVPPMATAKSSISRRFVSGTKRKLGDLLTRDLSKLDILVLFLDGIETDGHTIVVALGVDADGIKHPLGMWEGSTENRAVCQALLNDLVKRGLDPDRPRLVVIDGGKGIRSAVNTTFGKAALVHRCQVHKRRNILDHLPQEQRAFVGNKLDRVWRDSDGHRDLQLLRIALDAHQTPTESAAVG